MQQNAKKMNNATWKDLTTRWSISISLHYCIIRYDDTNYTLIRKLHYETVYMKMT